MSVLTSAVVAVVRDDAGHVLLCQQSCGHRVWQLPGGRIRHGESPVRAVMRDVLAETGLPIAVVDLIGLYQLTGHTCGEDVPDVLMHVFRARVSDGEAVVNEPGRISRASWYAPDDLPDPLSPTARAALADALSGLSGVIRPVQRDPEPLLMEHVEPVDALAPA